MLQTAVSILALLTSALALYGLYRLWTKKLPEMEDHLEDQSVGAKDDARRALKKIGELEAKIRKLEGNDGKAKERKAENAPKGRRGYRPQSSDADDHQASVSQAPEDKDEASNVPESKTLYAKNSQDRFLIQVSPNAEGAKYRISYDPETKEGTFVLTNLRKLASNDDFHTIVDVEGTGTVAESFDYDTLSEGRCREIEGGMWQVTRNLKIRLR